MTQPAAEVSLDAIEEIDEDPPPDPELAPAPPDPAPDELGQVDVEPSELEMGTVDPLGRGDPKPPTMGVVTPPPPTQPLGFKEPWVSFGTLPATSPEPPDLEALKQFFAEQRDKLTQQIAEIETQLGFIAEASDLAVRIARIENFLGIKA